MRLISVAYIKNLEEIRIFLCLIFLRRHEVIISVAGMMEDIMWFPLIKKQGRFWRSNVSSLKIFKLSDANLLFGMLGTRSYRSFPVWGRMEKDGLVQVVIPYELSLYEKGSTLTVPDELKKINVDSNPIFIVYKLREG